MHKKLVMVCVQRDIVNSLGWALKDFDKQLSVKYADSPADLQKFFAMGNSCSLLIMDSVIADKSTVDIASRLKRDHPGMKLLWIVSPSVARAELVGLIHGKVVSGVLMRPFTAQQVSDNIYKLCNFEKPAETPWYMQTNIKQPS